MKLGFLDDILVWLIDIFKARNPKLFAVLAVALVFALQFLNDLQNKGIVCSKWEETVIADTYVNVTPGDSVYLADYLPSTAPEGEWANEDDGVFLAADGGVRTFIYHGEGGFNYSVATNTCFVHDKSGIWVQILYWLNLIVLALTGASTKARKAEIRERSKS